MMNRALGGGNDTVRPTVSTDWSKDTGNGPLLSNLFSNYRAGERENLMKSIGWKLGAATGAASKGSLLEAVQKDPAARQAKSRGMRRTFCTLNDEG
jgi:hypothetical protein